MFIQNIWGVGRNFKDHAAEMRAVVPTQPIIFLKSGASINPYPNLIQLPDWTKEVHHEVELAVQITADGTPKKATIALDLTERHFQTIAKKEGLPWALAKSFNGATALGPWLDWNPQFLESTLTLIVNNEQRQHGSMTDLIFSLPNITQFLLEHFPVCDNDVILLGTPSGVGPLKIGDVATAMLDSYLTHQWTVEGLEKF